MLWFDRVVAYGHGAFQVFAMPLTSARQILGVSVGLVISVGGFAFSVTMLTLRLTLGQNGPEILRHFLEDNDSKI